jgi:hypothetical protein
MTYDPEANEAMQKPDTMGTSASNASEHEGASKPNASKKSIVSRRVLDVGWTQNERFSKLWV